MGVSYKAPDEGTTDFILADGTINPLSLDGTGNVRVATAFPNSIGFNSLTPDKDDTVFGQEFRIDSNLNLRAVTDIRGGNVNGNLSVWSTGVGIFANSNTGLVDNIGIQAGNDRINIYSGNDSFDYAGIDIEQILGQPQVRLYCDVGEGLIISDADTRLTYKNDGGGGTVVIDDDDVTITANNSKRLVNFISQFGGEYLLTYGAREIIKLDTNQIKIVGGENNDTVLVHASPGGYNGKGWMEVYSNWGGMGFDDNFLNCEATNTALWFNNTELLRLDATGNTISTIAGDNLIVNDVTDGLLTYSVNPTTTGTWGARSIPDKQYVDDSIGGLGDYETGETYTVSNVTPDRVFDPTSTNPNETAMVLATLIQDLKNSTDILL